MTSKKRAVNSNQLRYGPGGMNETRCIQGVGNNPASRIPPSIPLPSAYLNHPINNLPLPIRRNTPATTTAYNRLPNMAVNNYYQPYSRYPTNMYPSGYGGYRMQPYGMAPYNGAPVDGGTYNSFIQMAEESTRPAFESIESVVQVVSSISMMLESTYHAVHSSYSAILGVVDQFSRLRDHLAQMLSILALLRGLRWLCLKVLYVMRLRKDNPSEEAAWSSAEMLIMGTTSFPPPLPDKAYGSAWPFLMFLSLVVGAPWLMFKLLAKSAANKPVDMRIFQDENGRRHMATAAFDFKATQRDELSFSAGERLYLSPNSYRTGPKGWYYACNLKQETGLIPSNYLSRSRCNIVAPQDGSNPAQFEAVYEKNAPFPPQGPIQPQDSFNVLPNVQPNERLPEQVNGQYNQNLKPSNDTEGGCAM